MKKVNNSYGNILLKQNLKDQINSTCMIKLRKSTEYRRKSSYSVFVPDTTMESRRLDLFTSHSPARTCSVALSAYD